MLKKLTTEELEQIAKACSGIEISEYKNGGWKYLSRGFAICDMVGYGDDTIYLELTSGCQSDCDNVWR